MKFSLSANETIWMLRLNIIFGFTIILCMLIIMIINPIIALMFLTYVSGQFIYKTILEVAVSIKQSFKNLKDIKFASQCYVGRFI